MALPRPSLSRATACAMLVVVLTGCDMSPDKTPPAEIATDEDGEDATIEIPEPRPDVLTDRFARLALQCVHREYPNKISHVLQGDSDVRPPRELTPAFYGCFDWHSAVHGHWLLARILKTDPQSPMAPAIRAALTKSFTTANIDAETAYLQGEGRDSFERPYGWAWLLQLVAELDESDDTALMEWRGTLRPLEGAVVADIKQWLPKLVYPIRVGTHNQTAFAFGLMLDYARRTKEPGLEKLLVDKSREFYGNDVNCPLAYEPSGEDFLSPCLIEADLMRRVMPPDRFAIWLAKFLPQIPGETAGHAAEDATRDKTDWLAPGEVRDPTDGKLVHLDGVNLSRAWALQGIAGGLPANDPRRAALLATAKVHRNAGLAAVTDKNYEGSHWLGSFATYLETRRGLPPTVAEPGSTGASGSEPPPDASSGPAENPSA